MATDSALLSLADQSEDEISSGHDKNTANDAYIGIESDTDHLLESEQSADQPKESPFSLAYYTKLFDVDTDEIVSRLMWALCPKPNTSMYAKKNIRGKPDLYGPFWICVTLVFSIAIAGNVASYFQFHVTDKTSEGQAKHWHYNFHKVSLSAAIVFLYSTLVPSGLFAALWTGTPKELSSRLSLTELICIFGYCLAPFVPISLLWLIQISIVQWTLVLVSFVLSGGVLFLSIWPIVDEFSTVKSKGYTIVALVLALHLLLASGFMLCFFSVPGASLSKESSVTSPIANQTFSQVSHEEKRNVKLQNQPMPGVNFPSETFKFEKGDVERSKGQDSDKPERLAPELNATS